MPTRNLDPNDLAPDEDWLGNNAAFRCPLCHKVFIVSNGRLPPLRGQSESRPLPDHEEIGVRRCPWCHNSRGRITGGPADPNASATIEWPLI